MFIGALFSVDIFALEFLCSILSDSSVRFESTTKNFFAVTLFVLLTFFLSFFVQVNGRCNVIKDNACCGRPALFCVVTFCVLLRFCFGASASLNRGSCCFLFQSWKRVLGVVATWCGFSLEFLCELLLSFTSVCFSLSRSCFESHCLFLILCSAFVSLRKLIGRHFIIGVVVDSASSSDRASMFSYWCSSVLLVFDQKEGFLFCAALKNGICLCLKVLFCL
jgi:hypothetical protein